MYGYSRNELEAAHKALQSSYNKIEKARGNLSKRQPPPKPQLTLAERNMDALRIALALVAAELDQINGETYSAESGIKHDAHTAAQREAAFLSIFNEVAESRIAIPAELERLKAEGKEKTVRYRELFGQKLLNNHIAALFARHGLPFDSIVDS